jgi:hypothetical protein
MAASFGEGWYISLNGQRRSMSRGSSTVGGSRLRARCSSPSWSRWRTFRRTSTRRSAPPGSGTSGRTIRRYAGTTCRGSTAAAIHQFIRSNISDEFTIEDLRQALPGASDSYLNKTLATLRDEGIVASRPAGRGSRWSRLRADF